MLLCVIRFPVSLMILTNMLSPLGQLGPFTSVTTYRLLLSSVYHVGTALLSRSLRVVRNRERGRSSGGRHETDTPAAGSPYRVRRAVLIARTIQPTRRGTEVVTVVIACGGARTTDSRRGVVPSARRRAVLANPRSAVGQNGIPRCHVDVRTRLEYAGLRYG